MIEWSEHGLRDVASEGATVDGSMGCCDSWWDVWGWFEVWEQTRAHRALLFTETILSHSISDQFLFQLSRNAKCCCDIMLLIGYNSDYTIIPLCHIWILFPLSHQLQLPQFAIPHSCVFLYARVCVCDNQPDHQMVFYSYRNVCWISIQMINWLLCRAFLGNKDCCRFDFNNVLMNCFNFTACL